MVVAVFAAMAAPRSVVAQALDVVSRTRAMDGYIFDRPSLIVMVRVHEESKTEFADESPGSVLNVTANPPYWTHVRAQVIEIPRVNERSAGEPDLASPHVMIEQIARKERPLPLKIGRLYVLLLTPSPKLLGSWQARLPGEPGGFPPYALSVDQGGFEIVNGKLRVLKRGGPLDKYDGHTLSDVLAEMREHR
jgi:hypothetical protein